MPKILLITVGGSHQPIVTTIRSLKPDRVIFLCSTGSRGSESQVIGQGTPCEVRRGTEVIERLPNIPTQAELGERFQPERDVIKIQEPDDIRMLSKSRRGSSKPSNRVSRCSNAD